MSEYQWFHFRAIDQPLSDYALEFMRRQSTRASISRWEFTNEYHFGDFHGDTPEMLRQGYDVHLHYANFMVRHLAFRLPELPCDEKTFRQFAVEDDLDWQEDTNSTAGILWVTPDAHEFEADYFEDLESMLSRISPAREMLQQGDLRPLYLFWLACCYDEAYPQPPVPAGLQGIEDGKADDCLLAIVEFLEIDHDLLAIAIEKSPPAPESTDSRHITKAWLSGQSDSALRNLVEQLLTEAGTRQRVLREIRDDSGESLWPCAETSQTYGELWEDAQKLQQIREEERQKAKRIRQEKQRQADQKARKQHLKRIVDNPQAVIRRIDQCVGTKNRKGYKEATSHLRDFADALGSDAAQCEADRLRREFPGRSALLDELARAGL